jgi:hypothetical protein
MKKVHKWKAEAKSINANALELHAGKKTLQRGFS